VKVYTSLPEKILHQNIDPQNLDPKFRRATLNMIASSIVCQNTLKKYGLQKNRSVGFIYATHFGEIESSTQYLYLLDKENFGRPILFQNSLHNSTLGFVTVDLQLKGPSLTVSGGDHMNESILNAAESLLSICDDVLVCMSESIPDKYVNIYAETFPRAISWFNRSEAFLISKEQFIDSNEIRLLELKLI
jgi:hypothetical protein